MSDKINEIVVTCELNAQSKPESINLVNVMLHFEDGEDAMMSVDSHESILKQMGITPKPIKDGSQLICALYASTPGFENLDALGVLSKLTDRKVISFETISPEVN